MTEAAAMAAAPAVTRGAGPAPDAGGEKLLVGLVGAGIGRSLTPAMHEEEARRQGLRLHYQPIDLDRTGAGVDVLPHLVAAMRTIGFAGFNVTYPCKQAIVPLLDALSDEARTMGAVNTVVAGDGVLVGHNTDGSGWQSGFLRQLADADLRRVVLLGAGGAGSAIAYAALALPIGELVVCDTDPKRARDLAAALAATGAGTGRVSSATDIADAMRGATGLVHATPTGMAKLPGLPLPESLLVPPLWVSEIVYFPLETELVKLARRRGCVVADGSGMAVGQAARAFELFTGRVADAARMADHFRRLVGAGAP